MKKSIEQKRDELALEHFKEVNPHLSNPKDIEYYGNYEKSQTMRAYREGFNSGYKLAVERAAEREKVLHDGLASVIGQLMRSGCYEKTHPFSGVTLYGKEQLEKYNKMRGGE